MSERRAGNPDKYNRTDNKIDPRDADLFTDDYPSKNVEVSDLIEQASTAQKQATGLMDFIHEEFDPDNLTAGMVGKLMFGTEFREGTNPDGTIDARPWTMESIIELDHEGYPAREEATRNELTRELAIALRQQHEFFTTAEHPRLAEVEAVIGFATAITDRVLASEESLTEPFQINKPVTYDEAEMMEILRRTILEPTYMIMEGFAESDIRVIPNYDENAEFWDPMRERDEVVTSQLKDPTDLQERLRVQKRIALTNPRSFSTEQWEEILDKETAYLYAYALVAVRGQSASLGDTRDFLASLTNNGETVYSQEQIAAFNTQVDNLANLYKEMVQLGDFKLLAGWIKQKFGPDANFQTLLQALRPVDLNHKPTFEDRY